MTSMRTTVAIAIALCHAGVAAADSHRAAGAPAAGAPAAGAPAADDANHSPGDYSGRFVAGASVGAIHLDKITPLPLDTTSALVKLEVGRQLTGATTAKLRVEGFRADGINVSIALVAEVHPWRWAGFFAAAGASIGQRSHLGNILSAGVFGRAAVRPGVYVRADLFGSAALRNDFGGTGVGLTLGAEYRWRP